MAKRKESKVKIKVQPSLPHLFSLARGKLGHAPLGTQNHGCRDIFTIIFIKTQELYFCHHPRHSSSQRKVKINFRLSRCEWQVCAWWHCAKVVIDIYEQPREVDIGKSIKATEASQWTMDFQFIPTGQCVCLSEERKLTSLFSDDWPLWLGVACAVSITLPHFTNALSRRVFDFIDCEL